MENLSHDVLAEVRLMTGLKNKLLLMNATCDSLREKVLH